MGVNILRTKPTDWKSSPLQTRYSQEKVATLSVVRSYT